MFTLSSIPAEAPGAPSRSAQEWRTQSTVQWPCICMKARGRGGEGDAGSNASTAPLHAGEPTCKSRGQKGGGSAGVEGSGRCVPKALEHELTCSSCSRASRVAISRVYDAASCLPYSPSDPRRGRRGAGGVQVRSSGSRIPPADTQALPAPHGLPPTNGQTHPKAKQHGISTSLPLCFPWPLLSSLPPPMPPP